jgi:hypothetical protein
VLLLGGEVPLRVVGVLLGQNLGPGFGRANRFLYWLCSLEMGMEVVGSGWRCSAGLLQRGLVRPYCCV